MKKLRYRNLWPVAAIMLLALSSCIRESNFIDDGKGVIVMSLDGVQTRGGDLYNDDALVAKVRVLVHNGHFFEVNRLFTSGEESFANPFRVEVITGNKTVYVIANETAGLGAQLAAVQTPTQLETFLAGEISSALSTPLVMVGKTETVNVMTNTVNNTTVTLIRAAAKINLTFKKDTSSEVKITKVSLLKNTGKTPLFEGGATLPAQSYWTYLSDYSTAPIELTTSPTNSLAVYVYENLAGSANKANATQLEVEALFNNVPTTYRVYINEAVSAVSDPGNPSSSTTDGADHLYQIKRNRHYQVTGTIKNIGEFDGLSLEMNVLPWSYLPSTVSFERVYTLDPFPTYQTRTYTVNSTSDEVNFAFTLTNPLNATWSANLTNPADFEFAGTSSGATGETVTLKIKPKNAPGAETRTTEFFINVNHGGNWEEVSLISGQSVVGPGNRIVIQQTTNP